MSQGFDVSTPSVLTKKSAWNIYTALLMIALVALLLCMLAFARIESQNHRFATEDTNFPANFLLSKYVIYFLQRIQNFCSG